MIHSPEIQIKIRLRAFEIYEWRIENEEEGCALGDWLEAEAEILKAINARMSK